MKWLQKPVQLFELLSNKKDFEGAFEYFESLKGKGYRFYVQPMGALNYSDEEYVQLIRKTNELEPEAFYIVDSFGVMELKDFRRLLFLTDNNLKNDRTRPLLEGGDKLKKIKALMEERRPMYESRSDIIVEVTGMRTPRAAYAIRDELERMNMI